MKRLLIQVIHFDIVNLNEELKELEKKTNDANFWNNLDLNKTVLARIKGIQNKLNRFNKIKDDLLNIHMRSHQKLKM